MDRSSAQELGDSPSPGGASSIAIIATPSTVNMRLRNRVATPRNQTQRSGQRMRPATSAPTSSYGMTHLFAMQRLLRCMSLQVAQSHNVLIARFRPQLRELRQRSSFVSIYLSRSW